MKIRFGHVTNSSSSSYIIKSKNKMPLSFSSLEELEESGMDEDDWGYYQLEDALSLNEGLYVTIIDVDWSEPDIEGIVKKLLYDATIEEIPQ